MRLVKTSVSVRLVDALIDAGLLAIEPMGHNLDPVDRATQYELLIDALVQQARSEGLAMTVDTGCWENEAQLDDQNVKVRQCALCDHCGKILPDDDSEGYGDYCDTACMEMAGN